MDIIKHIRHYFMLPENIDRNLFEISVVDINGAHKTVQLLSKDNVCYVDIGDIST